MARITIDERGNVDPHGAAYVEAMLRRPAEHFTARPHNLPPTRQPRLCSIDVDVATEVSGQSLAE